MFRFLFGLANCKQLLILVVMIFFSTIAWADSAKIISATIDNKNTTRFILEISGAAFHYSWKLSDNKKNLTVTIDNVNLATTLPAVTPSAAPIVSYKNKIDVKKASLQLKFQLKNAQIVKVYAPPASRKKAPTLVVDFGTSLLASTTIQPLVTDTTTKSQPVKENPAPAVTENHPVSGSKTPEDSKINSYASIMDEQPDAETSATTVDTKVDAKPDVTNSATSIQPSVAETSSSTIKSVKTLDTNKDSKKTIMVVIDPGHGGKDSGAIGPDGTMEKNVVLAISRLLQKDFSQQPGFQAQLTRNRDTFIPLRQRLYIARRCKADVFIAIHADSAYKGEDAIGASVFALSEHGATSEMARWLAQRENSSELIYGVTVGSDQILRSVLLDLSQTYTINVSLKIGQQILGNLSNVTKLHDKRVEQAAFVVLKSPDIPSLLIETGYISNPIQEKKLQDPVYQQQLADAITQGVVAYFAKRLANH